MAQAISRLYEGHKIKDSKGNAFIIIGKNHYSTNQVTLMQETSASKVTMGSSSISTLEYSTSNAASYLNNSYLNTLDTKLASSIITTSLPCTTVSGSNKTNKYINVKAFILSATELGIASNSTIEKKMTGSNTYYLKESAWLRGKVITSNKNYFESYVPGTGYVQGESSLSRCLYPVFNVPSSLMVSDSQSGGYYSFVFDTPPTIGTISSYSVNFGNPANITYTASDDITSNLTHYITLDNGVSWTQIIPTKNGNNYSYIYQTGAVGTYSCRIKVVDGSSQQAISNLFTITVNASAPTVNVVSVEHETVEFKVKCLTHSVTKVEILVNGNLVKTYLEGFNSNLIYNIDKTILNLGKNGVQIKAISSENLEGTKDIEVNKELYNLPPVGTKAIIEGEIYSIIHAEQSGSNQSYILDKGLLSDITKGQEVKITQDSVKVLCSLSNLENVKDFKEMKLVKTKILKGQFEGYVEEKYELEGEGRYSAIKLETERFNNNVESEIIELQQYFDYMED